MYSTFIHIGLLYLLAMYCYRLAGIRNSFCLLVLQTKRKAHIC